jgi:hypothetical protein
VTILPFPQMGRTRKGTSAFAPFEVEANISVEAR